MLKWNKEVNLSTSDLTEKEINNQDEPFFKSQDLLARNLEKSHHSDSGKRIPISLTKQSKFIANKAVTERRETIRVETMDYKVVSVNDTNTEN